MRSPCARPHTLDRRFLASVRFDFFGLDWGPTIGLRRNDSGCGSNYRAVIQIRADECVQPNWCVRAFIGNTTLAWWCASRW